ncbi:hypothetical protein [Xenorhabdus doucetiae]|uniref:Uncharacterized protein n=1 Tax=Xenorhabdus doucetiae TaxID=351671 RepID=A0ABY3NMN3_9GAMM|nr:hypothetical protein [Xenorhabdus doucetiae]TYO94902.1 hypothetical protein LY16_03583 [Xenorhabdus doucetiae]
MKFDEWLEKMQRRNKEKESKGKLYGDQWVADRLKKYKESDEEDDPNEKLEILLSSRFNMIKNPLPVQKNKALQAPAGEELFYILKKLDGKYILSHETKAPQIADGQCIFVVTQWDPCNVRCARSARDPNYHGNDVVEGHTSISHRASVIFAGTLLFSQGELTCWTNASGHYRPPAEQRYLLGPYIRRILLPDEKFSRTLFAGH